MVASKMNLTLSQVKDAKEQIPAPSEPESTGSLVYNYNNPLDKTARRPNKPSNEENRKRSQNKRSRGQQNSDEYSSISDDTSNSLYSNEEDNYMQPRPKLTEAPQTPLLPYYIGNGGNSIQKDNKVDVVKAAKSIAQQIGSELQKPDNMVEEQTLEKFTILTRLVRTMNAEQIAEVKRDLIESKQSSNQLNQNNQNQRERRNAWEALRDAIAQAGTGPALVNVKQMIQNKNVDDQEAAAVIDTVAQSARTPTPQYMDAFFVSLKINFFSIYNDLANVINNFFVYPRKWSSSWSLKRNLLPTNLLFSHLLILSDTQLLTNEVRTTGSPYTFLAVSSTEKTTTFKKSISLTFRKN